MNSKPVSEWTTDELRRWIAERLGRDGNWPEDVSAAVDLLKRMPGYALEYCDGQWSIITGLEWVCSHEHPARAICEAWVQMERAVRHD